MFKVGQHWCHNSRKVMRIDSVRISHNPSYADIQGVCAHGSKYSAARTNPERHALFGWVLLNDPKVDEVWADRANPHNLYHITGEQKLKCLSNGVTGRIKGSMLEFHARCKYVGVMPKVGDTWSTDHGYDVRVVDVSGGFAKLKRGPLLHKKSLAELLHEYRFINRTVTDEPMPLDPKLIEEMGAKPDNFIFDTGGKEPLNASTKGRRFHTTLEAFQKGVGELRAKLHPWQLDMMDKVTEYCNKDVAATQTLPLSAQRNTIWRSRKGRYVTLEGVTPKFVHLRDTLTDEYVGFRNHADFLRTYGRVLVKGESWSYKAQVHGVVEGINGGCVGFFDRWVGRVEHFEPKDFLANAKPLPPVTLHTPQIGRGLRGASATHVVLDQAQPERNDVQGMSDVTVGSKWKGLHGPKTECEVVRISAKGIAYLRSTTGGDFWRPIHQLKRNYDPVPKGFVSSVRAEIAPWHSMAAKKHLENDDFTVSSHGLTSNFPNRMTFIEFCRAVLEEADKCQPST